MKRLQRWQMNVSRVTYNWEIIDMYFSTWNLGPDFNRHPTLHILVTCEVHIALQPGYISNLPVQLHTRIYSGLGHDIFWPFSIYTFVWQKNHFIWNKTMKIFINWGWERKCNSRNVLNLQMTLQKVLWIWLLS